MPKKLRIKDLKHDELSEAVTGAGTQAWGYASSHRTTILGIAGGAVLLVALVGGALWWTHSRKAAAETALGEVLRKAEKLDAPDPSAPPAPVPAGDAPTWAVVASEFEAVAKEHAGTPAGELAAYRAGLSLLRAGQPAEAATSLSRFVDDHGKHWATPFALSALASAREGAGDAAGAQQALEKLRDGTWRNYPRAAAIMQLGALLERQSKTDEARAMYELLAEGEEHADSPYQSQAQDRLQALGDESATPAAG